MVARAVSPPGGGKGALDLATVEAIASGAGRESRNLTIRVAWIEDLDFQVSAGDFLLDGKLYSIGNELVTLDAADGSNDRFDVIVAETDGTAGKVTGTPAADPAVPEVDPDTQVALVTVLVQTSATEPANITDTIVYDEDDDWTSAESDSGTTIDLAATADPNNGTKHIEFDAVVDGDYITLTDSATHSSTEFESLVFAIKNTVANTNNNQRPRIALYNSTTRVSDWIELRHGTYGFSGSDTSAYQNVIIPMSDFNLGGSQFDVVRFQVAANGANTRSFNLDDIKFQSGAAVVIQGVSQEDVDLAVLNKPEVMWIAVSDEVTSLTTGTAKVTFRVPYAFVLTDIRASVKTAPTGSTIIVDVNESGTTILSTKLTIDAGEKTSETAATPAVISDVNLADDAEITVDIDQVGSSVAGVGLKLCLIGHQA